MNIEEVLGRAGVRLSDEERERLSRNLAFYESQLAELRLPEARYAEPAVIHVPPRRMGTT